MPIAVSPRRTASERDTRIVKPGDPVPVIDMTPPSEGKIIVQAPAPPPHPPLRARAPNLPGKIHNFSEENSRQVSVRANPAKVDELIYAIRTRHLRPTPPVALPKINDSVVNSAYVVKPAGWVAEPPNYPQKLGATPFVIRPGPTKIPYKKPRQKIKMPPNVIHGAGAGASEEPLVVLPVAERGPVFVKIHDFGDLKTYKVELKKL